MAEKKQKAKPPKAPKKKVQKISAVPKGFSTVTPHIVVRNAPAAIEFYGKAFGATVKGIHNMPDGKVMHAALKIGDSLVMMNEEFPQWGALSPLTIGNTAVTLHVYVKDVDSWFERAVAAGATVLMPVSDTFWGDRYGVILDPYGHKWSIATHREDLTSKQVEERAKALFEQS